MKADEENALDLTLVSGLNLKKRNYSDSEKKPEPTDVQNNSKKLKTLMNEQDTCFVGNFGTFTMGHNKAEEASHPMPPISK